MFERFRRWIEGEGHVDVDLERASGEVVGRLDATTDRLCRAVEQLEREIEEREAEERPE